VLDNIDSVLAMLGRSPLLGRSRDELAAGLRSFPVGNFVIFYLPRGSGITVVRVLSGFRDLPALFE
jgi:toxin ParE1/3/4